MMDTVGITFPDVVSNSTSNSAEGVINNSHSLFYSIADIDNLYLAFSNAKRGKRNRKGIFEFENNLIKNLEKLQYSILNFTYKPSPARVFHIDCNGKDRLIEAPKFEDSVVQHAIYQIIYPIFDRSFIHDSYGCRIGKGTRKCVDQCQRFMRQCDSNLYYIQMDFRKYYYSINHKILDKSISHKIKCKLTINLIRLFYFRTDKDCGLGIGNLLSQLFGLIYLNRFDHYTKRVKKCKRYIRYVDDTVVLGITRQEAIDLRKDLIKFAKDELGLSFSKINIKKIKSGINFCGYRTWKSRRFIRKRSLMNFNKALRKGEILSIQAILEHSKNTSSYFYLLSKLINRPDIIKKLPKRFKKDLWRIK